MCIEILLLIYLFSQFLSVFSYIILIIFKFKLNMKIFGFEIFVFYFPNFGFLIFPLNQIKQNAFVVEK